MSGDTVSGVVRRVVRSGGLPADVPLVVALSGGRDSVCLLDLLVRLRGADGLLAVHVHHGLRGRDADVDAHHSAAVASRLGVAVRVVALAPRPPGPGSIAVWAREQRAAALVAVARRWDPAARMVTGHTASDQAETVLLRAVASPGARSLAAIRTGRAPGDVLRPLLWAGVTRAETTAWCRSRGLSWRDDPTNAASPRGRMRALLAALEVVDPRATGALVRTAELAREDDEALVLSAAAGVHATDYGPRVAPAWLLAQPRAVGRRALRLLAESTLGGNRGGVAQRLEDVERLARRGGTAALDVGDGVRVRIDATGIACEPVPRRARYDERHERA